MDSRLNEAREKEFRKPLGIDKNPTPATKDECLEAIHLGLNGNLKGRLQADREKNLRSAGFTHSNLKI